MTELATAYISVVPEVNKAIQAAYSDAAKGGQRLGEALGSGISSGAGAGLDALKAKAQATSGAVQKAARDMAAAEKAEADAAGTLRVAVLKLNEARESSTTKASALVAAEERVAKAQRTSEAASKGARDAAERHETALTRAKTATDGFSTAQASVGASAGKSHGAVTKLSAGMGKLSSTVGSVGKGMAGMFAGFGALAAGAAISTGIGSAIKAASDLNETVNKSNVIFKGNAAAMETWASGAAKSMGLSKKAALESAAGFGNMFTQLGFSSDAAAEMSKQVVLMSADLGSFNNLPTGEVTEMISAAFRGEYDSLQRLIPNISAARVEQEALAMTHKSSAKDLTASEKAAAVLAIVQKDGAAAAGDFARTSGEVANQQKIQAATSEDLSAKFGEKLLPAMRVVQEIGIKITDWISENSGLATTLAIGLGILAAAFIAVSVATWAWNAALAANPIVWVIAGIAALIAAIIWAWNNFETFRNVVTAVWEGIKTVVTTVVNWFMTWVWPVLQFVARSIIASVVDLWQNFVDKWNAIRAVAQTVADWFTGTLVPAFQRAWDSIKASFQATVDVISGIWNKLIEIAKAPVRFIINTVINDGLINGINTVAGWLGLGGTINIGRVPLPAGFREGGWTGPGGEKQPAGFVHADEFVVKKKSRRGIERAVPGFLDALNTFGARALGFAAGGRVAPVPGGHSGWGSYAGHTGLDFPVPIGTRVVAFLDGIVDSVKSLATSFGTHVVLGHAAGIQSIYAHLSQALVSIGQMVTAGQQIGLSGSSGNSTGPHLHFELRQNGKPFDPTDMLNGAAAPGGSILSNLKDRVVNFFRDNINNLLEKIPGSGPFRDVMVGGAKKLIDTVADFFTSKAEATDLAAAGTVGSGSGAEQWRGVALQALALAGQPASLIDLLLHRIQVESGGAPKAVNNWDSNAAAGHPSQGLMQTIPSTFAAYAGPLAYLGITNPLANIYAAIQYTNDRYRGNFGRAWGGTAGYAEGGLVEPLLLDAGGIIPRGVSFVENRTGSPEALFRGGGGMPDTVVLQVGDREFTGYLREEIGRPAQMAAAGRRAV